MAPGAEQEFAEVRSELMFVINALNLDKTSSLVSDLKDFREDAGTFVVVVVVVMELVTVAVEHYGKVSRLSRR